MTTIICSVSPERQQSWNRRRPYRVALNTPHPSLSALSVAEASHPRIIGTFILDSYNRCVRSGVSVWLAEGNRDRRMTLTPPISPQWGLPRGRGL